MAEETLTILKVNTDEAVKSVGDLRSNIKTLKQDLSQLEIGTDEYQKTLRELITNQNALRGAMNGTTASMDDVVGAAKGLATTYNGLVNQMAALRKEQRNIDISTQEGIDAYNRLGAEIDSLNTRLKELDATNGNYQRNVGNYKTDEVVDNFKKLRSEIRQYRSELLGLEEGTDEYYQTMQKLADAQFRLRDANETARWSANDLGEQIATVNRVASGLAGGFSAVQGAMAVFGAESEDLEKAMLRVQGGIALVQGLQGLEGLTKDIPIMINQFKMASVALNTFVKGLSGMQKALVTTGIGALLTAVIAVVSHWEDIIDLIRGANEETEELSRSTERLVTATKDEYSELQLLLRTREAYGASQKELMQEELSFWESRSRAYAEQLDRYNGMKRLNKEQREEYKTLTGEQEEALGKIAELQERLRIEDIKSFRASQEEKRKLAQETARLLAEAASSENVEVPDMIMPDTGGAVSPDDSAGERLEQELALRQEYLDRDTRMRLLHNQEAADGEYEIQLAAEQRRLELLQEYSRKALEANDPQLAIDLQMQAADQSIAIEQMRADREQEIRDEEIRKVKEAQQQKQQAYMTAASAIGSVLGSLSTIIEADSDGNEEAARQAKNLQIASATINTISGAIAAYMGAVTAFAAVPGLGPVMGAIQAATVLAAGMAQIAQIRNTDVNKDSAPGGSGVSAMVSAPAVTPQVTSVRNITSASEEDRLNRMSGDQRVYILSSDIEASQNQRKTQVRESSF